jgi:hypothetical protein
MNWPDGHLGPEDAPSSYLTVQKHNPDLFSVLCRGFSPGCRAAFRFCSSEKPFTSPPEPPIRRQLTTPVVHTLANEWPESRCRSFDAFLAGKYVGPLPSTCGDWP